MSSLFNIQDNVVVITGGTGVLGRSIAKYLHKGMMVVLESTTYPGTTEELIKPILESSGLKCGEDFYLGFSPERVDPGNLIYKTKNTPKVVGGLGKDASEVISAMYEAVLQSPVFRASSVPERTRYRSLSARMSSLWRTKCAATPILFLSRKPTPAT